MLPFLWWLEGNHLQTEAILLWKPSFVLNIRHRNRQSILVLWCHLKHRVYLGYRTPAWWLSTKEPSLLQVQTPKLLLKPYTSGTSCCAAPYPSFHFCNTGFYLPNVPHALTHDPQPFLRQSLPVFNASIIKHHPLDLRAP